VAVKKDNLPLSLHRDDDSTGSITYANEVIAISAGVAANEVEGIAGMCTSGGFAEVFGRNRSITKGVKVEIGSEEASVDLYVVVEYGTPIQTAAANVQESVRKAIETMTGLHVVRVDVHVQGVSFEKENKEFQTSLENAELEKVTDGSEPEEKPAPPVKGKKKGKEPPKPAEAPDAAEAPEPPETEAEPAQPEAPLPNEQVAETSAPSQDEQTKAETEAQT
jgi:uncharacterized alkaline shock family protein YloU